MELHYGISFFFFIPKTLFNNNFFSKLYHFHNIQKFLILILLKMKTVQNIIQSSHIFQIKHT